MLPLDGPRWLSFKVFFGESAELPRRIKAWQTGIATKREPTLRAELTEQFLHQFSITEAAYAAVPHVIVTLASLPPRRRLEALAEVGLVEAARQGDGTPRIPHGLSGAYTASIERARAMSLELFSLKWSKDEFRHLLSFTASLHGHGVLGELLFNLGCLGGSCPSCGEFVHLEEIEESGYGG